MGFCSDVSITYLVLKNPTYVGLCDMGKIECVVIETTRDGSIT